jgi:hypothetical protein
VEAGDQAVIRINKIRSWLYLAAKLLGDANAVQKDRVIRRLTRRTVGKWTGRMLGKLFR